MKTMKTGDRVVSEAGMRGTVLKIVQKKGLNDGTPMVTVQWENGYIGRLRPNHMTVVKA